jgi:squalene synthase HpnC
MIDSADIASGKGHRQENFPVASRLVSPRYRPAILAFYQFARAADDVADHARLSKRDKLALLDGLEETLLGNSNAQTAAIALRAALKEHQLSPRHALDLLVAFRLDVTKNRYDTWQDLLDYCRYSAMPVGRFVLDLHGEHTNTWPANDALCAALQIINHLQDCGKDYRCIDRVYVPLDALSAVGIDVTALGADTASPALRQCLSALARKTAELLDHSAGFASMIVDFRLSLEVTVIQRLAQNLVRRLSERDPLSEPVHLGKLQFAAVAAAAALRGLIGRLWRHAGAKTREGGTI